MNLQYISDSSGKTTGVFIPISEWIELKSKYKGIEDEESLIPSWHQSMVKERIVDYKKDPNNVLDFDTAMGEIENDL